MGIKFDCQHCGRRLHVKDFLAGKRGICPHCQGAIDIPTTSRVDSDLAGRPATITASIVIAQQPRTEGGAAPASPAETETAPAAGAEPGAATEAGAVARAESSDPIAEAPDMHWYVLPAGSLTKYGPASGEAMRSWLAEGRVAADSLVWREGWPQWRAAAAVFPDLAAQAAAAADAGSVSAPQSVVAPAGVAIPVAQPTDAGAALVQPDAPPSTPRRRRRSRRNLAIALLCAALCALLPALVYVLWRQ